MASDDEREGQSDGHMTDDLAGSLMSALKSKELLVPAAVSAIGAVAATKGPDLLRRLTEDTEQRGEEEAEKLGSKAVEGAKQGLGNGGFAGKALSKAIGGVGGGGGSSGGKKTRRLPIQRWTDVAVPIETAYEAWTKFDDFPRFMHRVLNVEQKGKDKVSWQEKIWFSKRQWEGEITDRRKNDRIAWKTTNGMSHRGIVTFHKLGDSLTRVMVDMEFEPNGMIEKMASGLRFVKRAVQADLARFKAYVELQDAKGIDYRPNSQGEDRGDSENSRSSGDEKNDKQRTTERREREQRRQQRQRSGTR